MRTIETAQDFRKAVDEATERIGRIYDHMVTHRPSNFPCPSCGIVHNQGEVNRQAAFWDRQRGLA